WHRGDCIAGLADPGVRDALQRACTPGHDGCDPTRRAGGLGELPSAVGGARRRHHGTRSREAFARPSRRLALSAPSSLWRRPSMTERNGCPPQLRLVGSEGDTAPAVPGPTIRDTDWAILMAHAQDGDGSAYQRLLREITPYLRSLAARRHRDP